MSSVIEIGKPLPDVSGDSTWQLNNGPLRFIATTSRKESITFERGHEKITILIGPDNSVLDAEVDFQVHSGFKFERLTLVSELPLASTASTASTTSTTSATSATFTTSTKPTTIDLTKDEKKESVQLSTGKRVDPPTDNVINPVTQPTDEKESGQPSAGKRQKLLTMDMIRDYAKCLNEAEKLRNDLLHRQLVEIGINALKELNTVPFGNKIISLENREMVIEALEKEDIIDKGTLRLVGNFSIGYNI